MYINNYLKIIIKPYQIDKAYMQRIKNRMIIIYLISYSDNEHLLNF